MEPIEIIRLILIIAVIIYLAFIIAMISLLFRWRKEIDRNEKALRVLIQQRVDIHKLFIIECHQIGIDFANNKQLANIEVLETIPVSKLADFYILIKKFDKDMREHALLSTNGSVYLQNLTIQSLLTSLDENEKNFRRKAASYNRNVATYNYWSENIILILISKLFHHHSSDKI